MIRILVCLVAMVTWIAGPAYADELFKDNANGFSVEIPDRWVSVSPNVMTQINSAVAMFLKQKVSYLACFVPYGHTSAELPRIMIQFQPWDTGIPTYEALEESLKRDVKTAIGEVKKESGSTIRSVELGQISLDRKENRIVMRLQAAVRGEGTVQALSVGMLGKNGIVFLHCYATDDKFTRTVPLFEVFADSFKFAPGHAYDPAEATVTSIPRPESSRSGSFSWFGASRGGLYGGLIGGAIGVLALVARVWRRRFA
jgi:hypothetical protein